MAVPWGQIIQWAPQIIGLSRELLSRARGTKPSDQLVRAADPNDLPARVAALEENERRQAELVDRMASQQSELSKAVVSLHRRLRVVTGVCVLLALGLVWALWRA